jgi:hypothetical protein
MQGGMLACVHVEEAVWTKKRAPVNYQKVVQDVLGDGTALLGSLVCSQCIRAFGIDPAKVLPFDENDQEFEVFPYVAPICARCLAEYQETHAP